MRDAGTMATRSVRGDVKTATPAPHTAWVRSHRGSRPRPEPPARERRPTLALQPDRVHDSAAMIALDVPWWTYRAIDEVEQWLARAAERPRAGLRVRLGRQHRCGWRDAPGRCTASSTTGVRRAHGRPARRPSRTSSIVVRPPMRIASPAVPSRQGGVRRPRLLVVRRGDRRGRGRVRPRRGGRARPGALSGCGRWRGWPPTAWWSSTTPGGVATAARSRPHPWSSGGCRVSRRPCRTPTRPHSSTGHGLNPVGAAVLMPTAPPRPAASTHVGER